MHKLNRLIALTLMLLLTSCMTTPSNQHPPLNQTLSLNNRTQSLTAIQNWNLDGVIAVRHNREAWSANWQWQQNQKQYLISFFGPLGSNAFKLSGNATQVTLATSDGKKYTSATPETLLAEQLGWTLPVTGLYYWIRGLPVPNAPAETRFDAYNHLTYLAQDGWRIQFLRYTSIHNTDVPSKIFLSSSGLSVKVIVNRWIID